jgi:ribonuclease HIII
MQTTYRLKSQEISMTFLKSLKTLFEGQEVEIIVKSVGPEDSNTTKTQAELLQMIQENSNNAPVIAPDINIRDLIDESQHPSH